MALAIVAVLAVAVTVGVTLLTPSNPRVLTVATTTSTVDTGLLDYVNAAFEAKYGVAVKVVSVGTGQALKYGERGDADLVLVHARPLEEAFVAAGFGIHRVGVMYNDFIVLGPSDDPAGLAEAVDSVDAFKRLAKAGEEGRAVFVSRGDKSGTHFRELSLWEAAGITPQGKSWYIEAGGGMGSTLIVANEKNAYTLSDRGTFVSYAARLKIALVFERDVALLKPYGAILVNPELHPKVKYELAVTYIAFLISDEGQELIGSFRKNGQQLFTPLAQDYSKAEILGFPEQRAEVSFYLSKAREIEATGLG